MIVSNFQKGDTELRKKFTKIKIMCYIGLQGDTCSVMTKYLRVKENNF